nr:hypothetical protein CFP56_43391 [Quercus suber]
MREEEDIPSTKLRLACNSFNNFAGPIGFQSMTHLNLSGLRIKVELDSWMHPDYFPVLTSLDLSSTSIVSIPESISKFTMLRRLCISDCRKLQEIPRLPQSIRIVTAPNCDRLDTQSSSRLLNQFGEILGILPNTVAASVDSERPQFRLGHLILPVTEIPEWLKFNHHQSVGNSAVLESDADCEEETFDQPMLDVPKNTTLDGFESDTNSGNEAPNPGDG